MSVSRGSRFVAYARRTAGWIPASVIGLLFLPMGITRRSFGSDWTLHLWALRQQQWNIEAMGHPGLFLSARPLGAFYPLFAFTGSGIYSVGGYLAVALGPIVAYKLLNLAGLCLAYGGFTWLAVQFGLRGWRSQIPGAVFVTGAYVITDMVGRGDFAEFIALASIPFVIAAITAYLKELQVGPRHRLAVVLGVFVLSGSHNITLLWGATFVALSAVVGLLGWASTWPRPLPWKRIAQLIGLGAVGGGLNAWYLFPDVAYGFDTLVGSVSKMTRPGTVFVHPALLLNPLRPTDHSPSIVHFFAQNIRLSFPCLIFAWTVVVVIVLWRKNGWVARRLFLGLLVLTVAFAALVMNSQLWSWLPRIYWNTQFTWRLDGYVLLGTTMLTILALVWQAGTRKSIRRWTTGTLIAVVLFNLGAAVWQEWRVRSEFVAGAFEVPTHGHFVSTVVAARYVTPRSWYAGGDFRDISSPVVGVTVGRAVKVPYQRVRGSSFSGMLAVPDGSAPFVTNIAAGPRFVRMTGITAVGRTPDGFVVAVRAANTPEAGPLRVTIREADNALLRTGAIVSVLSALALLAMLAWPVLGARYSAARFRRRTKSVE
jgi:hypothetical protein